MLNLPDVRGKIVLVYLKNRPLDDYVVLQQIGFEMQADRSFLVGVVAEGTTTNDWAAGIFTAIAWDSVEQYMIFDSLEDYFAREAQSYEPQSIQ